MSALSHPGCQQPKGQRFLQKPSGAQLLSCLSAAASADPSEALSAAHVSTLLCGSFYPKKISLQRALLL